MADPTLKERLVRELLKELTSDPEEIARRDSRERIPTLPPIESDPLVQMAGADDFEPQPIDEVVCRLRLPIRLEGVPQNCFASPACLRTAFKVPGGTSRLAFPATGTCQPK